MADDSRSEDDALVERMIGGDHHALELLYDRHVRPVFSLAVRMLSDVNLAEEVVQEVFLKLWQGPARYQSGRDRLRAWLLSVTHNRSIDLLRSTRTESAKRAGYLESEYALLVPDADPDPADVAWQSVQQATVRRALESLLLSEREAIELAFFKGMTHSEISESLNVPLGTIKTRLRRGMRKLRSVLEEERNWAGIS